MANEIEVPITGDTRKLVKALNKATNAVEDFGDKAVKSTKKATGAMEVFKGVISANALTSGIRAIGDAFTSSMSKIVSSTLELETIETRFITLTGSIGKAKSLLEDLQMFAASTPFQLPGISNAASKLLSFGIAQDEVIEKLKQLGDVAAGSGADLNEVTLIFGQVAAAGKLTGERLLQFQERAIPIGPALAKNFGIAESAVKDFVSAGKVSFADFEKAFASLSAESGMFFGGMIRQSKTLGGVLSTMDDVITLVSTDIGKVFLPVMKDIAIAFTELIVKNRELIKVVAKDIFTNMASTIKGVIETFKSFGKAITDNQTILENLAIAIGLLTVGFGAYSIAINAGAIATGIATAATWAFNAALAVTPWGLAIAATALFVAGIRKLYENFEVLLGNVKLFGGYIMDFFATPLIFALKVAQDVASVFDNEMADSIGNAITKIENMSEALKQSGRDDIENAKASAEAVSESSDSKVESIKKVSDAEGEAAAKRKAIADAEKLADEEALEKKKEDALARVEAKREEEAQLATMREEVKVLEMEQEELDKIKEEEDRTVRFERLREDLSLEDAMRTEAKLRTLERQGKFDEAALVERKSLAKARNKITASETRFVELSFDRQTKALSNTINLMGNLSAAGGKKNFETTKKLRLAEAVINGIGAVQNALNAPFPLNVINAALVGAISAANVAQIASSKPPAFAGGGIVPGTSFSGDQVAARVNSGEMILNRTQQSSLFNSIDSGGTGGSSVIVDRLEKLEAAIMSRPLILMADDQEIARSAQRGFDDGIIIASN